MAQGARKYLHTSEDIDHAVLAVAAHELRHPIQLLRLALERYLPEPHDPARVSIDRHVNRMARLVDDLVDFIRTERDALELQREWIDLDQLLGELIESYQPAFRQRQVQLTFAPEETAAWLNADGQRLVQIFSNVLDNALKFTAAGGSVHVRSSRAADSLVVRVADNGRGMTRERAMRVFDTPGALDATQGLGIGLLIAHRIARLHGGEIKVSSEGEGRGTEVVVMLPVDCSPIARSGTASLTR